MFGGQLGTTHHQFAAVQRPLAGLAFGGDDNFAARASWRGIQILSTVHFACQRENHKNTKNKGGTLKVRHEKTNDDCIFINLLFLFL